jgi:diacylglycerol kinase (ATP)
MERPFSFAARGRSFRYAFRGLWLTLRGQHNAWIHTFATFAVVLLGLVFRLTRLEWCAVILACAAVWTAESLNTAIEYLADATKSEIHPLIANAKDVAAGAVLAAALAAVAVGILVFLPHVRILSGSFH